LLRELRRVVRDQAWLSCPDLEKVCGAYCKDRGRALLADRMRRWPRYASRWPEGSPPQQFINDLFHQFGEHKNLFDFELLSWALNEAGWSRVVRVEEADLLQRFPGFPPRGDDLQTLYVLAE